MKSMRIVEKKMNRNREYIERYASIINTEKPYFETEAEQKKEVNKYIQANLDLFKKYLELKRAVEVTNLNTIITVEGYTGSISEILVIKRKLAKMMEATYSSLNDVRAERMKAHTPPVDGKPPHVVRLYDEKVKNESIRYWQDLYSGIDARLEVINATTDIITE
jgi:hypothetical protein